MPYPNPTYPHYRQITETGTIIRLIGRNPDGTLIADALFGKDNDKGWWRLVPLAFRKIAQDTNAIGDFDDRYPQEFFPHH